MRVVAEERRRLARNEARGLQLAGVGVAPLSGQSGAQLSTHWSF